MVAAANRETQAALGRVVAGTRSHALWQDPRLLLSVALEREWAERRFFLWLPVAAGAGVTLYFCADTEPNLVFALALTAASLVGAIALRHWRRGLVLACGIAAVAAGFSCAALRTASIAHPVIDRVRIAKIAGVVEEIDHRRTGARFILRIGETDGTLPAGLDRIRLTTRRSDPLEAGDAVRLTARLVPPATAAMPGGYSFARDAYFAELDAVGSVLGQIRPDTSPATASLASRVHMGVDRVRNALAARVSTILPGDVGAIAAAMVTGKRDLLSEDGRDLIREAGIFHIITIAGVQMTLVAGLLYGGLRAALAAMPPIALRHPIKIWAAAGAMVGAVLYDVLTGSRIGTQRALFMTLIMLGAVLLGRRAFTMRNLAMAAMVVIAVEPEAILGASFQLSFAAVAALVAVQEGRWGGRNAHRGSRAHANLGVLGGAIEHVLTVVRHGGRILFATVAATSATAPVMASNFHEISPYVVIGNPLTLSVIEFFAVPGALLGSVLYPLGLDRFVWHWVGWGIEIVLWAARLIAAAPGATLTVPAFAPWSLACFALATCSVVIWRSPILRLIAVPFLVAGLAGSVAGPRYDLIIAASGDAVAFRDGGRLALAGRLNAFGAEQWLRADGDGRDPATVAAEGSTALRCDATACIARLADGKILSLVAKPAAFEEDCSRADLIVTPLYAPASCAAELIVDRGLLARMGALAFRQDGAAYVPVPTRTDGEDRPWLPPPTPEPRRAVRAARPDRPAPPTATDPASDLRDGVTPADDPEP